MILWVFSAAQCSKRVGSQRSNIVGAYPLRMQGKTEDSASPSSIAAFSSSSTSMLAVNAEIFLSKLPQSAYGCYNIGNSADAIS